MNEWIDNLLHFEELIQCFRILLALILGAIIGFEREIYGRPAGLRTHMLVCAASSLAVLVSVNAFEGGDPARLAAQVITGIGFIGAGAIIRGDNSIIGITTAATIFVCAIIGLSCGSGYYFAAILTTILALVVLTCFTKVETKLSKNRKYNSNLVLTLKNEDNAIEKLKDFLNNNCINISSLDYKAGVLDGEKILKVNVSFEKSLKTTSLNELVASLDKELKPIQCKISTDSFINKRQIRD